MHRSLVADQFTTNIIQAALDAAADEMFEVLRRTSMSPIIYEVLDVGTGLTDANGALVSSGAGIPSFVGVLDKAVQAILSRYGQDIHPGDVFATNDPNHGGVTHLNDMVVAQPIFSGPICVAWAASIAHWGDIGGKTPGSMPVDVTDIFGEGLRVPIVKLVDAGKRNLALWDIIQVNSRLPEFINGDLHAQLAAGNKAAQSVQSLCDRYGIVAFEDAIQNAFDEGARRAQKGLKGLTPGEYKFAEPQDDGSTWNAKIRISQDRVEIDLTDNPGQQNAPYNTSRDGAVIACQMIFKALTDPTRFASAGSFSQLVAITKPGTIFHAEDTVPQGYYFETRIRLVDMLWHCLAKAMPDRLPAGHFGSIFGTVIAGTHPDTGRRFTMVEPQMGGWGATSKRDGMSAMYSTSHGDTFNCPVEIAEARYGLIVMQKSLAQRHETGGKYQGGHGVKTVYQMRGSAVLSVGMSHAIVPTWSHGKTQTGGRNSLIVRHKNGDKLTCIFASGVKLGKGTQITIETAQGGSSA